MTSGADGSPDERPVVTVILLTYNHEAFIGQALAGILEQRAPFSIELIVTEDCSTDRTLDVVENIRKQSGRDFTVLSSPVNLCSNVVFRRALDMARGEFVATLDGDDYWTDSQKLVRQVSFLRERPDFSMCYHDVLKIDDATGDVIEETSLGTAEITQCDLILGNHIPGCSPLIRRSAIERLPASFDDAEFGDWPLYLEAVRHGRIGGIGATMGVYRLHGGGIWTGTATERREVAVFAVPRSAGAVRAAVVSGELGEEPGLRHASSGGGAADQGRRREARPFAYRSLATPGIPGYGRRVSVRLAAQSTSPRLFEFVCRARRRLRRD